MTRLVVVIVRVVLLGGLSAGCATSATTATAEPPWAKDYDNCAKQNRVEAASSWLADFGQFGRAQMACLSELGYSTGELVKQACATEQRYAGNKIWFQGHWEQCAD
jgi:hypothetical protein